jgi:hypothetical protein
MPSKRFLTLLSLQLPYMLAKFCSKFELLTTSSLFLMLILRSLSSEHYGRNGGFLSDSRYHDQRFPKPGEASPATGSYQVLSQLPDQHQPSTSQSSRHPNFSPHYLPGSKAPCQKGTLVRNPDFVFSSTTCKRDGDFEAPTPKRFCYLHEMHQGYDVQSEGD